MFRIPCCCLLVAAAFAAADPAWLAKPISQWNRDDAGRVLAGSPWVKWTRIAILPERGEAQMRDGGKMGGGGKRAGLGLDPAALAGDAGKLMVRWESAAPVRAAEVLTGETAAPEWDGDYYVIALYDVPGITPAAQKNLRAELKQVSFLKRAGKKDVRLERVDIDLLGSRTARIVYLFPRSAALSGEDRRIEFVTQIGRIYVSQFFETGEMQFQGKLEL